jgi:adenine-specific DNA-methyltransferase
MNDAGFGNKYTNVGIAQRRYLGSKAKLLDYIEEILVTEGVEYSSFLDIFAGTGVVANRFYPKTRVIVNDILEVNYLAYQAFFGNEAIRSKLLSQKIFEYNEIEIAKIPDNYFSINFSDTYFDKQNSVLIGHIRDDIENLYISGAINSRERAYLVTSLIYSLDRIANTVGHYDAYRKVDIPRRHLILKPLNLTASNKKAYMFKKDANELAREVKADITYIDPPYNSRQYSDAYHLLENIASWHKEPVHGVAKKINRDHIKSQYSMKTAGYAFSDLIENLDTKYILVSYNDMGTSGDPRSQSRISDHELMSALERKGEVKIYEKPFKQFSAGKSFKGDLKERIFFCRVIQSKKQANQNLKRSSKNSINNTFVKSPLNYTGGKHKLLPQLIDFFPKNISTFYDVFCGAANVGINAVAKKIICIDNSDEVISLLTYIQSKNFEDLHQKLEGVITKFNLSQSYINGYSYYGADSSKGLGKVNKKAYIKLREAYNKSAEENKTLLLLVLVLYGFNNQLRFNSKREFNLPVGKRDYNGSSRRNIEGFNITSKNKPIKFKVGDYKDIVNIHFKENDFVYLDPPYFLGLATYNENGRWSEKDEIDLHKTLDKLNEKKVKFALSNVTEHKGQKNKLLLNWVGAHGYNIHHLKHNYKNSNYQSSAKHGVTSEVLITNYNPKITPLL